MKAIALLPYLFFKSIYAEIGTFISLLPGQHDNCPEIGMFGFEGAVAGNLLFPVNFCPYHIDHESGRTL